MNMITSMVQSAAPSFERLKGAEAFLFWEVQAYVDTMRWIYDGVFLVHDHLYGVDTGKGKPEPCSLFAKPPGEEADGAGGDAGSQSLWGSMFGSSRKRHAQRNAQRRSRQMMQAEASPQSQSPTSGDTGGGNVGPRP